MARPYCLVVIDMQTGFRAALCQQTIQNVKELVQKAKNDMADIVILEYTPSMHNHTHKEILDLIDGYEFGQVVEKNDDDGSRAIKDEGYENYFFRLCGVNTSCCVARTARGMSSRYPQSQIDIDFNACNQPEEWENQYPEEANLDNLQHDLNSYNNIRCLV